MFNFWVDTAALGARINALLRQEDYYSAIVELRRLLSFEPDNATAIYNLGICYYKVGEADLAIPQLLKFRSAEPTDVATNHYLALCYEKVGDDQKTVESFKRVVALVPQNPDGYLNLAVALWNQEQELEALRALLDGLVACNRQLDLLEKYGELGYRYGDYPGAKWALETSIWIRPYNALAHHTLGLIYLAEGNTEQAEASLELALRLGPATAKMYFDAGSVQMYHRRFAKAAESLEKAVSLDELNFEAHFRLMVCYQNLNQMGKAIETAEKAEKLDPELFMGRVRQIRQP